MKPRGTRRGWGALRAQVLASMLPARIEPVASAQTTHTLPAIPPVSDAGTEVALTEGE